MILLVSGDFVLHILAGGGGGSFLSFDDGAAVAVSGGATAEHVFLRQSRTREAVVPFPEAVYVARAEGVSTQNCKKKETLVSDKGKHTRVTGVTSFVLCFINVFVILSSEARAVAIIQIVLHFFTLDMPFFMHSR